MSDHRETEHELVDLALGEVPEPRRSELLSHLTGCLRCRGAYAEIVDAIDATVPAAPEAQPPAGFDLRVLETLGIGTADSDGGPAHRVSRWFSPRTLVAAAGVALVAAGGLFGVTAMLGDGADEQPPVAGASELAEGTAVLETADGARVGTAAVAWMDDSRVLVISVHRAPVGVRYSCRVRLAEGEPQVLGRWEASSTDGGVWVVPAPQGDLNAVELVTDSGQVWSSTALP